MTDSDKTEPLSNISDSSFVILGPGSLSSQEGDKNGDSSSDTCINVFDKSSSTIKSSDLNTVSEENVQEKLQQVLRENYQLRETLSQNNLALKSQLDTFIMWQQEVLKTHETHKQKFLETKDLILKLRAENAELKKQLGGDYSLVNDSAIKNSKGLSSIGEASGNFERMCKELTTENENLKLENQQLRENVKVSKNEIVKISNELEDALRENRFLKQRKDEPKNSSLESFPGGSLPNSNARAQISNLLKQLEEEREKVSKLKQELEQVRKCNGGTSECTSKTKELSQCINKLDNMDHSLNKQNQRFISLQSWVSLAEENVSALVNEEVEKGVDCLLRSEINQLKTHLDQEENACREKQESLKEMRGQFQKLLDDYRVLQQKLTMLQNNESSTQRYEDESKSLSEELKVKGEDLVSKQAECDKLKEDIKKLNLECEKVALLRIQVDLYKTYFVQEREAKEKLVEEKEEMAEQLRLLRRDLVDDKGKKTEEESSPLASDSNKTKRFICPKCSFGYSNLRTCQEHIEECVNTHMYP